MTLWMSLVDRVREVVSPLRCTVTISPDSPDLVLRPELGSDVGPCITVSLDHEQQVSLLLDDLVNWDIYDTDPERLVESVISEVWALAGEGTTLRKWLGPDASPRKVEVLARSGTPLVSWRRGIGRASGEPVIVTQPPYAPR